MYRSLKIGQALQAKRPTRTGMLLYMSTDHSAQNCPALPVHLSPLRLSPLYNAQHGVPHCQRTCLVTKAKPLNQEKADSLRGAQSSSTHTADPERIENVASKSQSQPAAGLCCPGMKIKAGAEAAMRASKSQPCQTQGAVPGAQWVPLGCKG